MKYNYPNITPAYTGGVLHCNGTLSAKYFQELFHNNYDFNEILPFIQRIPVTGFFSELFYLESENIYAENFKHIQKLHREISFYFKSNQSIRIALNYMNILIRYGITDFPQIEKKHLPPVSESILIEIELLYITASINQAISQEKKIDIQKLVNITKKAFSEKNIEDRIKILTGLRLIVTSYRFSRDKNAQKYAKEIAPIFLKKLNDLPENFNNLLYKSISYRGVAMIESLSVNEKTQLLIQSEELARNLSPNNQLEKIVRDENLYTLLQTLTKWYCKLNKIKNAKLCLDEMIKLDPFDSTAYSEMGLFLLEQNKHSDAAFFFKSASNLGPPSVGMNLYFYAKCLEKVKGNSVIPSLLHKALTIDPDSISAALDLIDYYKKIGNIKKLKNIVNKIISTENLITQLNFEEKQKILSLNI
jgi:hypothetical protein